MGQINNLNNEELTFWNSYTATLTKKPVNPIVFSGMAGNEKIADELLQLYLNGKKTAGSGLMKDYLKANEPLPQVNQYWIILDSKLTPKCIVQTIKVEVNRFDEVPEKIAIAEGEGDLSISYWRTAHKEFFKPFLKDLGISNLNEELIITEYFKVIFR